MSCECLFVRIGSFTQAQESKRTFEPVAALVFSELSCFVISKQGYEVAKSTQPTKQIKASRKTEISTHHSRPLGGNQEIIPKVDSNQLDSSSQPHAPAKPIWDRERRELRLGDIIHCLLIQASAPNVVCMTR